MEKQVQVYIGLGLTVAILLGVVLYQAGSGSQESPAADAAVSGDDSDSVQVGDGGANDNSQAPAGGDGADDEPIESPCIEDCDGGDPCTENCGGDPCTENCEEEPLPLASLELYLGASDDACEEQLILDVTETATHVDSCEIMTSGYVVNKAFRSEEDAKPFMADSVVTGTIFVDITYSTLDKHYFWIDLVFTCDGTDWAMEEIRFDQQTLEQDVTGWYRADYEFNPDSANIRDAHDECLMGINFGTNLAAVSANLRFDENAPSFLNAQQLA